MRKILLFTAALLLVVSTFAQSGQPQLVEKVTANPGELKIGYEKWVYPNGLTLYIHEDKSDPIVHVEVTYHVGSARETPGKSGFAHLFEHMMFQGSLHVADEEHFKIVQGAGGQMNGTTNRDRTNYFQTVPKNYLEKMLWLEADRMGFLLDSITQTKFENQRATVKNEKDQRVTNVPYGRTQEVRDQILYPSNHPYSWPTIGFVEDLNRVDAEDLRNFFLRWYGPNNASIVVAGDVDPKEVVELVNKYFGSIPKGPEVRKMRVDPVRLSQNVYANYGDNIILPLTLFTFPTVPAYHPDEAALNILAYILGDGNNSILYQELVKKEKLIQATALHNYFPYLMNELAGEFTIQMLMYPSFATEEVQDPEELLKRAFEVFERRGVSDDDIARAIGEFETGLYGQMQSIQSKSALLSQWHYLMGNKSMNLDQELARYKKVTKADIMRVYNTYLKNKYAAVVNVFPKQGNAAAQKEETVLATTSGKVGNEVEYKGLSYKRPVDNFDRSKRPEPKGTVTPVVPQVYTSTMRNGIKVIGTENSDVPMVTLYLTLQGGNVVTNDPKKSGLAMLTALMMEEATQNYTAEQFSSELSKLGASIDFSAGTFNTTVVFSARKDNLDKSLALFEEKLLRPKFTPEDFRLVQRQLAEQINSQRVSAGYLAQRAFANLLYGKSILAEPVTGSIKNIKSFSVRDVQSYYDNYYSPSGATLVIVGDVKESEILSKLNFLANWQGKAITMPNITVSQTPPAKQPTVYLVDKYKASQSEIRIGNLSVPFDYNGKFYKARIMNFPLGGNFNSRLNLNLREDKGITYGVSSYFAGNKYVGSFSVGVGVRATATDTALKEIFAEINNYVKNGITPEELRFTQQALSQSDALRYETQYDKAGFLSGIINNDLPINYIEEQNKILQALTKADVDALAKEMLVPANMIIVVVGDKEKVSKQIQSLGYKIVEYKVE